MKSFQFTANQENACAVSASGQIQRAESRPITPGGGAAVAACIVDRAIVAPSHAIISMLARLDVVERDLLRDFSIFLCLEVKKPLQSS